MNSNKQSETTGTSQRKLAIAAGVLFLITHVTSVGAAALYTPILSNTGYIVSAGSDTLVIMGALFEVICALAIVGTAVALFPAVKKWNEGVALGYVGLRTLEAGIIAVGVVPMLAAVTLRQQLGSSGADPATLVTLGKTFVVFYNWTALIGPGLVCGMNTILMSYLMYKSQLVPRFIPVLGLVGGPLIFVLSAAKMFGMVEPLSAWAGIAVIPIFSWELTLAIRIIVKGFRSPVTVSEPAKPITNPLPSAA